MKKLVLLVGWIVLLTSNVWAESYTGVMDNRYGYTQIGGFTAQGNAWYSVGIGKDGKGFKLDWIAENETDPDGNWTYTYTLTRGSAMNKGYAYFDIEAGSNFSANNVIYPNDTVVYAKNSSGSNVSGTTFSGPVTFNSRHDYSNAAVTEASPSTALNKSDQCHVSSDPGRVSPGVSGGTSSATNSTGPTYHDFFGLRWTFPGTGFNSYTVTQWQVKIVSDKAPMWGSFFAWGDQTSQSPYWYANVYNDNLGSSRYTGSLADYSDSGPMAGWILVPGN